MVTRDDGDTPNPESVEVAGTSIPPETLFEPELTLFESNALPFVYKNEEDEEDASLSRQTPDEPTKDCEESRARTITIGDAVPDA